ncbi:unnamed protein product [Closterium sp. NIES-54]
MASRVLVSGLPWSLPPLPPEPAPTCVPCVEGRQRAAPHSSEFPPTEAPLQTLHMDVWGPARVRGQGHERYFLLVVDDYSRYTTVFPLRSKGDVTEVLIDWIRAARLQLRESFGSDIPVLRLHSDRGGEFSSARLGAICHAQGIRQTFTLPASPQQNGIAERRIGMVMDVARTSMIHAAAPHFLWPFAVLYAAHQLNLQPRVSLPETSPTLRWTGKVGDASAFRVWGSRAFVRDLSADNLSPRAVPCVFLGFPLDAPGWQFFHPTSRRVLSSQDVTFDESVPYYRLFPYRIAPLPPPPLFLALGPPPVDPLPPQGPASSGVSQVDAVEPVEVAVDSGPAGGAESGGAEPGGAGSGGAEPGGAASGGAESGGAEPGGAEPGGAESARVASRSASSRRELLSPQELREWFARRWSRAAGAGGPPVTTGPGGARTGGTGAVGTGGAAAAAGVGPAGAAGAAGAGAAGGVGARVGAAGASGAAGAGAAGGVGAGAGPAGVGAVGAGGAAGAGATTGGTGAVPGRTSSVVSQVDPLPGTVLVEVAVDSGAARGAASGGAEPRGAEPGGAESEGAGTRGAELAGVESGGAEPAGVEPGGAESGGAESGGAEPQGTASLAVLPVLRHNCLPGWSHSPRSSYASGLLSAHAFGVELPELATRLLETRELEVLVLLLELVLEVLVTGILELLGLVVLGALELETLRSLELLGREALALEELELEALALGALELEELELLRLELEVLELGVLAVLVLEALCGHDRTSFPCFSRFLVSRLLLAFLLLFYVHSLTSRSHNYSQPPHSLLVLPTLSRPSVLQSVVSLRLVLPPLFALLVGFLDPVLLLSLAHTLWHFVLPLSTASSSFPLRVPLPAPPQSSLPTVPDLESHRARVASPTVSRLLATVVTDPSFESTVAFALLAELVDFAAAYCLDYATALIAESESTSPPSIGGECALSTDVLEDRQEDFECLAAAVPRLASMQLAPEADPDDQTSRPRALKQKRLRVLTPLSGRQPWMPRWHNGSPKAPMSTQFPCLGQT